MPNFLRAALALGVLGISLSFSGCAKRAPEARVEFIFGTVCSVRIQQRGKDEVYRKVFDRLHQLDSIFNVNKQESLINEINRQAGKRPVSVPEELIKVVGRALFFAELSDGAFDPTAGPLVKLWGIGSDRARVPGPDEIERALSLVNWRDVVLDGKNSTIFLKKEGMMLDAGGIAKGYAADEALKIIKAAGVEGVLIDFGGNIVVYGEKAPGGATWRIGIQHPHRERGEFIGVIEVEAATLVTSGNYERFFEYDGRRYHHILSTKTGYPVENDISSVTVVRNLNPEDDGVSMDADALSTTLFALGYDAASTFISRFDGVDAVFILKDGGIRVGPALSGRFTY
ncbi:MAG: FAD:protein FMN transferase [Spirochaetaceae bacterium]|jgi:thiamine biosynthesis lipoprotein|nr:FAD:protein FMN transferase [Spirochaetaceae bacterium]